MNKKIVVSAFVAAFLATSASAFAQDARHQNDRGNGHGDRHNQHDDGHGDRNHSQRGDGHGDRSYHQRDDGHGNSNARWNDRTYRVSHRGAGPRHDLHKGARLPSEYRSHRYVVNDWRGRRLSAPPRGYHWVQTGGDYVLAAVATGLIAQIFLNN